MSVEGPSLAAAPSPDSSGGALRGGSLGKRRALFVLLAIAAPLFLGDLWTYRQFARAESYFALGARDMVARQEWLTPRAPDEEQLNKPPLTYWLIGVSYHLGGVSYGTARLPSALAALAVLVLVYLLGASLGGAPAGALAAAMLASSYLFLSFARMAMSDMLLTLSVTAAFACFTLSRVEDRRALPLLGYVALALGALAKGPVALLLVAPPVAAEWLLARGRIPLSRLRLLPGLALITLIVAPYFLLVYSRAGVEPLRFFLIGENVQRFTGSLYEFGARPFWYTYAAFFGDFAPWSLLIYLAVWLDWRRRARAETISRGWRLIYLWLLGTVAIFSFSSFKRDYYLLPAMPAAALIIGHLVARAGELPRVARRLIGFWLLFVAVVVCVAAWLTSRAAAAALHAPASGWTTAMVGALGASVVMFLLWRGQLERGALALAATIAASVIAVQLTLAPSFARYLPAPALAASVPAESVLYTSWQASGRANDMAFNLPPGRRVERLVGDFGNLRLRRALREQGTAALVWEREYLELQREGFELQVLGAGETRGRSGLDWRVLWRRPEMERLLLIAGARR